MNKVTKKISKDSMESNVKTICICIAPRFYKRTLEKDLNKKHRIYGKDMFLTVIQNKGKIDDCGENIYNIATFKQVAGGQVRGEKDLQEILERLKTYDNNQSLDATNLQVLDDVKNINKNNKN